MINLKVCRKKGMPTLLFFFISLTLSAQHAVSKVRGLVTNQNNEVLSGVSVVVRNNETNFTIGTLTDSIGVFNVSLSAGGPYSFTFSIVGYQSQTLSGYNLKGNSIVNLDVSLSGNVTAMDQVVVVGYGTQKKSDVTGAIASVNATTISRAATPNVAGALQGNLPGVVVTKSNGKPGNSYNINIRGISSIGGSSYPLIVVDGIPSNINLGDLNPADIEKIDILKDASATAIYGSRGAKGVVIVTTKKGKSGKTTISYDGYAGLRVPTNLPTMFTGAEYVAYRTEQFKAQGRSTDRSNSAFFTEEQWGNIDEGKFTDWPSLILKNGLQMSHNVTASGGDDKTTFSFSAGLLQETGNVDPEDFKRYSLRGNVDRKIGEKWRAGMSFYLAQNLQDIGSSEALRSSYRLPPITYPYDSIGNRVLRVYGNDAVVNPMFDQENEIRRNRNFKTFGNFYVQVEPLSGLILKSTISPSYSGVRSGYYYGPQTKERGGGSLPPQAGNSSSEQLSWVLDNQAIYSTVVGEHKIDATIVQSLQKDRYESNTISVEDVPYKSLWYNLASAPTIRGYGSEFTKSTLVSAMGRINYGFKNKYLLTLTGRWDGSSRLAEGNQWGFFPSSSIAWRISQEEFMSNVTVVDEMKVRVSYGVSGNDRVDPYSTQATLTQTYYDFGGIIAGGYAPGQLANKELGWETTREINVGLDATLFKGRVSGTVDIYDRTIDNILLNRPLPVPTGYSSITYNIGKLKNSGVEVGLTTVNVKSGRFSWRSDFVYDRNKNEILELLGGTNDIVASSLFIGQPAQVNYDYQFDGIWQTDQAQEAARYNQKPGQVRVKDIDNNGVINANDRQIIGKRIPNWTGSFANTFRYGNLDLYILVYTRQGEQFNSTFDATFMSYNAQYNQVKVDYWTPERPSNSHFQPGNEGPYAGAINYRNVDFTRIGNITLGYHFSNKWNQKLGVDNCRLYVTATNPFTFTKFDGFDPEWPTQNTYGTAISTTTYLLGVSISF